jgi:two-component system, cell cycle response regulator DivK
MERRRTRRPPERPLVLVVDGNSDTRELYAEALSSFGFEIETVDDVADAYTRAWETHPDIMATEISLSTHIDWKFIQDLKRDPRTRDIPVVIVTSQAQGAVRERAEREGCAAFLVKPCLPDDLATTLRDVLTTRVQVHDRVPASH